MGGKGKNNASRSNQTTHFGIMGGLAPSTNIAQGVKRFRLRRARNKQTIPLMPVPGLQYMKEKDILSKNPAGSGGVGLSKVLVDRSMGPCNCGGGNASPDSSGLTLGVKPAPGPCRAPADYAGTPCTTDFQCNYYGHCPDAKCSGQPFDGPLRGTCQGPGWPLGDVGNGLLLKVAGGGEWDGEWIMYPVYPANLSETDYPTLQGKWVSRSGDIVNGYTVTLFAGMTEEAASKKYRHTWIRWWVVFASTDPGKNVGALYSPTFFGGGYPGPQYLAIDVFDGSVLTVPANSPPTQWGSFSPFVPSSYTVTLANTACPQGPTGDDEWDIKDFAGAHCTADQHCSKSGLCNLAFCNQELNECNGPGYPAFAVGSELQLVVHAAPVGGGSLTYTGTWTMIPHYTAQTGKYIQQGIWTSALTPYNTRVTLEAGVVDSASQHQGRGYVDWWITYTDTVSGKVVFSLASPSIPVDPPINNIITTRVFTEQHGAGADWLDASTGGEAGYVVNVTGGT